MTSAPAILERRRARRALAAALAMGVALLAVAPFLGILRDLLIARLPRAFAPVLLAGFAPRRRALLLAAGSGWRATAALGRAPQPPCSASSAPGSRGGRGGRIHVLVTCWPSRAFAPRRDLSAYLLAFLATALCGILDEWVQWLVPTRVGDIRDVGLNAGAAVPGLLVAWAAAPGAVARGMAPGSRRPVALAAAAALLALAGFYDAAHLGHQVESPGLGSFRSWHAPGELAAVAAERAERWRVRPPGRLAPLSREDYFLTEGTWRVTARNAALAGGDLAAAWIENLTLRRTTGRCSDPPRAPANPAAGRRGSGRGGGHASAARPRSTRARCRAADPRLAQGVGWGSWSSFRRWSVSRGSARRWLPRPGDPDSRGLSRRPRSLPRDRPSGGTWFRAFP